MNIDEMKDRIARAEEIQRYTENRCEALEKENAELKAFINAPLIKGRRTTRKEFYQTIWDLSGQLTKAKEIIKKIEKIFYNGEEALKRLSKISDIIEEAEQFLKEVEK